MSDLLARIRDGEVLVGDGALGTMLMERGLRRGDPPELLNLMRPDLVAEIARLYLEAGADHIVTNTFGGSRLALARHGLADRVAQVNRSAVEAARRAMDAVSRDTGRDAILSASIGPSGRILRPHGDTEEAVVYESYLEQLNILAETGIDAICIETMMDLAEARLAIRAARAAAPDLAVIATMTFERTPRGFFTIMGASIPTAARQLEEAGADLVGSNCGLGSEAMIPIAREFREHTSLPLIFQPNAGLPDTRSGRAIYRETPEFMAERACQLADLGASIVGGCCGTTPEHIRALRRVVDAHPTGGAGDWAAGGSPRRGIAIGPRRDGRGASPRAGDPGRSRRSPGRGT